MKLILILLVFLNISHAGVKQWFREKTCSSQFLSSLTGIFKSKTKFENQIDIFSKKFDSKIAIKVVEELPPIERKNFYNMLMSLANSDEKVSRNITELINEGLNKKLIKVDELDASLNQLFGNTLFYSDALKSKVLFHIDVSPVKTKIIQDLLGSNTESVTFKKFQQLFLETNLSEDELTFFYKLADHGKLDLKYFSEIEEFIYFTNQFSEKKRQEALSEIFKLFDGNRDSKLFKKFEKEKMASEAYQEKRFKKLVEKYTKENNGKITEELKLRAYNEAKGSRLLKDRLKNACRAKSKNNLNFEDKALIDKRKLNFTKFVAYSSVPLSVGSFALGNWDQEKTGEWYGKMGYEIAMGVIFSTVGAKFQTNDSASFLGKFWSTFRFNLWADVGAIGLYASLFGKGEEEVKQEFERLKNDPNFHAEVKRLAKFIEEEKAYEKIKDKFEEIFMDSNDSSLSREDIEKLTVEDLENDELKEIIFELIAEQIYEEGSGELIATGNAAVDRYTYYQVYSLLGIPKSLILGVTMFRVMCRSVDPKKGMAMAISILLFNKLIINPLEYKLRNYAIGK